MKKIKEIFADNGIFSIFATNYSTEFNTLFSNTTAAKLDNYILINYGNLPVNENINNENVELFVNSVIDIYLAAWLKINSLLNQSYNTLQPITETKTKTGNVSRETTENNENNDFDKVFNDTDFVGNNKQTENNESEVTETYNLTETRAANSNSEISKLIENEILLRKKQNLTNEIINTFINELTIKIF